MSVISDEIKRIFNLLKKNRDECRLSDIFSDLPEYYDESDFNPDNPEEPLTTHGFLSQLRLFELELPENLADNSIIFSASINTIPEFLKNVLFDVPPFKKIECSVVQNEYGEIIFIGRYKKLDNISVKISTLSLIAESFEFSSGTTSDSYFVPQFKYGCILNTDSADMRLNMVQTAGCGTYEIHGAFSQIDNISADKILEFFGINGVDIKSLLPNEVRPSIFDNVLLKTVSIEAGKDEMYSFSAYIGTKEALSLMSDKITFVPEVYISVIKGQYADFYAYGTFQIGESSYELYLNPADYQISIGLKRGSILDIASISKLFFDIDIPSLKFDNLRAVMNFHTGMYEFEIGTADVLQFEAAGRKISIDNIMLGIAFNSNNFSITLAGKFDICGFSFGISGNYLGKGGYSLACSITNNISIKLSDLTKDFFHCECLLSEHFNFDISTLSFRYVHTDKKHVFSFSICANFCGTDKTLKKLFNMITSVSVAAEKENGCWKYALKAECDIKLHEGHMLCCSYNYNSISKNHENVIDLSYKAKTQNDVITFGTLLKAIGFDDIDESQSFITDLGITFVSLKYDFEEKKFTGTVEINSGGKIEVNLEFGEKNKYAVTVHLNSVISFSSLPVVGGITNKFNIDKSAFCVKDMTFYVRNTPDNQKQIPAGVRLDFTVFNEPFQWQIYEKKALLSDATEEIQGKIQGGLSATADTSKILWLKIEKNIAIFTLNRIGIGLDGSYITLMADASLNVSPLSFDLLGAGIGFSISDFNMKFYISGFGISYTSDVLTIGGSLMKSGKSYSGLLTIQTKPFALFAAAEYSDDGSLFAYAVASFKLGGSPAFYINGVAFGFGYNKRLLIPDIEHVVDYPLIKAASGRIAPGKMLSQLESYITDEKGQRFIVFGLEFSTYEIALSSAILTVNFGNNLEVDLMGISDITMPPKCKSTPIAHAQLALMAAIKPDDGFFGIEARLTSESYILSKDCHLTGGFAFYMWFSGEHSGDFVITLGGYHPQYYINKPSHYPDAPRVGFNWNIGNHTNINGEVYFALTPGALMAGGRLSMTYTHDNLKAYFIAKADFLISWKPFHYDAEIGVTVGASYRLKILGVSKTLSLELGSRLHIWGPDFSASLTISIWILSFTIHIGANADKNVPNIGWGEFCSSFLPKREVSSSGRNSNDVNKESADIAPVSISFVQGLSGVVNIDGSKIKAVQPYGITINVESAVPFTAADINGNDITFDCPEVNIKPMGKSGKNFSSKLSVTITDSSGKSSQFNAAVIRKNIASALWGGNEEVKKDVPCGFSITSPASEITLFPKNGFISLEDLYLKGSIKITNAFIFKQPEDLPDYTDKDTIKTLMNTINSDKIQAERKSFIESLGVNIEKEISLKKYAEEADRYLDEEVLIPI